MGVSEKFPVPAAGSTGLTYGFDDTRVSSLYARNVMSFRPASKICDATASL